MKRRVFFDVFLALLGATSTSRAECRVTPAPDGEVSTWLVRDGGRLGPIPARPSLRANLERLLDARAPAGVDDGAVDPSQPSPAWVPASSPRASLDVGATLGGPRRPRVAWAALALTATRSGPRYLALGTDDAVAVFLDGREVFRRSDARASREDDDLISLDLSEGDHRLVLKLVSRGDMDLLARVVGPDHRPDPSLTLRLPNVDDAVCARLADASLSVDVSRTPEPQGIRADLLLRWPGGTARAASEPTRAVSIRGAASLATQVDLRGPSIAPLTLSVRVPDAPSRVELQVGGRTSTHAIDVPAEVTATLRRARDVLGPMDPAFLASPPPVIVAAPRPPAGVSASALWSVERTAERLAALVAEGDRDTPHLRAEAQLLGELLDGLAAGRDPYRGRVGAIRRAYRSPLDGTLQEYSVYIPPSYRGDRPFPVIVGLHGLHGSAHRMLPILVGIYDEAEGRAHAERYTPPLPDLDAILVAPFGHGDSGYRQQGEYDVVRVVEEVHRAYRTDPARTYITGLSMGGIGAAGVPFHRPDLFAASAALCGYHSYFVRTDTRGVRRPWETFLMELRSNDRIAENGLHLPLYVVQGTLDRPLANSQVLVDRYQSLGYSVEAEWPTLGHNVWSTTYANGRIVPWFLRHRRDPEPASVRLRTYELRWNRSAWVSIDAIAGPRIDGSPTPARTGRPAEVSVSIDRRGAARATTTNVLALTLSPPRSLVAQGVSRVALDVDGDTVSLVPGADNHLTRASGHWTLGDPPAIGGGGPIREVFIGPMLFVVGTADPALTRLHERVARHWAHRPGVPMRYPVVTDEALTDAMAEGRTLVLIGTARSNRALARVADRLPIRLDDQGDVLVGARRIRGSDLGAVFTAPDPDRPARTLLVITGNSPRALLRAHSLPDLIPGYVVYDEGLAPARGRILLGPRARVLAAGFFDALGRPMDPDTDTAPPAGIAGD